MKKSIAVILVFVIVILFSSCKKEDEITVISPYTMMEEQTKNMAEIDELLKDMAQTYSQYFANNTTKAEFKTDVEGFQFKYENIMKRHVEFIDKKKIDDSKPHMLVDLAITCLDEVRLAVGNILDMTLQEDKVVSRDMLYEYYIFKKDEIKVSLYNYQVILDMGRIDS